MRTISTPSVSSVAVAVLGRTRARTSSPRWRSRRVRAVPMNPLAPVTRTRMRCPALARRAPVDAVPLGAGAAAGLDAPVDEVVVLERPGDLAALVAEAVRPPDRLHHQHRVDASAAPPRLHAQGHQADPVDLA